MRPPRIIVTLLLSVVLCFGITPAAQYSANEGECSPISISILGSGVSTAEAKAHVHDNHRDYDPLPNGGTQSPPADNDDDEVTLLDILVPIGLDCLFVIAFFLAISSIILLAQWVWKKIKFRLRMLLGITNNRLW